jgi:hypothetical protein
MKNLISLYNRFSIMLITPPTLSGKNKIILIFLSLTGVFHILLSTSLYGAGLSPDSVYYISAARNLAEGKGLVTFYGTQWTDWPPLYPIILALPAFGFKIDPLASAPFINAILFGSIVYMSGVLLSRHLLSSVVYWIVGIGVILLSSDIMQNLATMAWSETLFIFFVLLFLVYLEKFLERKDKISFIIFSLSAAFACLTRYIGGCLIITGVLALLFFPGGNLKFKMSSVGLFIFIAALPIAIWLLRNHLISGTITGHRDPGVLTLSQNLSLSLSTLRDWIWYPQKAIQVFLSSIVIIIVLIGILGVFAAKGHLQKLKNHLIKTEPIALFIIIYLSSLLLATTIYKSDPISWRLLSPLYVPAAILFLSIFDILLEPVRERFSPLVINRLLVGAIMAWLVFYPLRVTIINTHTWMTEGTGGYSRIEWRNSELVRYMQQHRAEPGHLVFSNEGDILYILADITCQESLVKIIPDSHDHSGKTAVSSSATYDNGYDYFVWFDKFPTNYHYTKEELEKSTNVQKIIQLSDGAVFRVYKIP